MPATDKDALVERLLRQCPQTDNSDAATMHEAADFIQSQAATIVRLQVERDGVAKALRNVLSIPALRQVLGANHTAGCDCPICRAERLLPLIHEPSGQEEGG